MRTLKKISLASAVAASAVLAGCGGSSGGSSAAPVEPQSNEVGGTVSAPGGVVAQFEPKSWFEVATGFLAAPVAAAITGLDPVEGATVELIRVDNDGNQVGDVLATTTTSITGDYTLTLPAGTDLAGNLVVRITGTNNNQLRAQVVDQEVDIDPISEFILQKFIDRGADLASLQTDQVVKLKGQAEQFDLAATSDLSTMLAALDAQLGEFVDGQVDQISTPDGDVTEIAGDFRSGAINLGLQGFDGSGSGSFAIDIYSDLFELADNGSGDVGVTLTSGPAAFAFANGADDGFLFVGYSPELADTEIETFPATFSANGVLTIEGEFEEDVDGDFGFRFPPITYRLQKNPKSDLMFLLAQEAVVRYRTIDTNGDGEPDAVDPDEKDGDEVIRSLEYLAKLPTGATNADLTGAYGLVSFVSDLDEQDGIRVETEATTAIFNGAGTLDVAAGNLMEISRDLQGNFNSFSGPSGAESVALSIAENGTLSGDAEGFVNESFEFIAVPNFNGENQNPGVNFAEFSHNLLVKLPGSTQPTLSGRTYRLFLLSATFEADGSIFLNSTGFDSTVTFGSGTEATLTAKYNSVIEAGGLGADITVENAILDNTLAVSLANGSLTMVAPEGGGGAGETRLEGFVNPDGSLAVMRTSFDPDGSGTASPNELGLAILVELP